MPKVLGLDLASANWVSNGSAVLTFEHGAEQFSGLQVGVLRWPGKRLTPEALADVVDEYARAHRVAAIAMDGPQGWRDPETPEGIRGVGRRCEWECRTQAKTGVRPHTFPANQRGWVEFSIGVFSALLLKPGVRLASVADQGTQLEDGYLLLESFPTSSWRFAGLTPLPGKSRRPDVSAFAAELFAAFGLPRLRVDSHDDLQAVVAALAAAGLAGGPVEVVGRGVPAVTRITDEGLERVEGLIWEAKPVGGPVDAAERQQESAVPPGHQPLPAVTPQVRVTQAVVDQIGRAGRTQAQIALRGFPKGNSRERVHVVVQLGEESYPLVIGDVHAAWVKHQTGHAAEGFDRLFALLADNPDQWLPASWSESPRPPHASPGERLASAGAWSPEAEAKTVSIPVRVVDGVVIECGREALPRLSGCVGQLTVPASAVEDPGDLKRLTETVKRVLLVAGTPLLCRLSGPQAPDELRSQCRVEPVPDSTDVAAFVEILLEEDLLLIAQGAKPGALGSARCAIPVLGLTAESLNEAYSRISEKFEPKRRSHGGNVFRHVYYFSASKAQWRPLGELRGDVVFAPR